MVKATTEASAINPPIDAVPTIMSVAARSLVWSIALLLFFEVAAFG